MSSWYGAFDEFDQSRIIAAWKDAPIANVELLRMLLDVAREQVLEYAPAASGAQQVSDLLRSLAVEDATIAEVLDILDGAIPGETVAPGDTVSPGTPEFQNPPVRYVYAQLQQAKNLWNAGRVMGNGEAGVDGWSFVPRPLDKDIQRIIRPVSGVANVF